MKKCNKCFIEKELNQFPKNKKSKDGHLNTCKSCHSEGSQRRNRTVEGKLKLIFFSLLRMHGEEVFKYSLAQFIDRYKRDSSFISVFEEWELSGFNPEYSPVFSVTVGYFKKAKDDVSVASPKKGVIAINILTGEETEFYSLLDATVKGGFDRSCVNRCLNGYLFSHKNHRFEFKK